MEACRNCDIFRGIASSHDGVYEFTHYNARIRDNAPRNDSLFFLHIVLSMNHSQIFLRRLYDLISSGSSVDEKTYAKMKNEFSSEFSISNERNIDLIEAYRELVSSGEIEKNKELERVISRRKVRTESGVAVITCLTKPFPCPGKCVYCPSEPNMPKSYLSNQPAAMRAVLNHFDPFNQTQNRLASLMVTGHDTSKVEVIVIGGTWSFLPKDYQEDFIRQIYNGLNQPVDREKLNTQGNFFKIPKIEQIENLSLESALKKNETAEHRCVGMTLETRPDFITVDEIQRFRKYGCTRVELGVQSLNDEVQKITKRGHDVARVRKATQLLRDAGFKIAYHLMPGLPGSNHDIDMESVRMAFTDPDFLPDLVKFYPCMVVNFSELAETFKRGEFTPLTDEDLKPLLIEMKRLVPRFTRITRLVRDIPAESVLGGCKTINMRQLIQADMEKQGITCQCIRCREIKADTVDAKNVEMRRLNYKANGGDEIFLTFDEKEKDKLISLLRLRIPSQYFTKEAHFLPELENCALIREVHTYGIQTVVGGSDGNTQHFGFGRKLLAEAERIAQEEYGLKKIAVIAGTGVREYYRKFGYELKGTYMVKEI